MNELTANEIGVILLSCSFLAALIVGGIAGKFGGLRLGAGAGMVTISAMSLAAAWITWQAGDQPDRGLIRVEGAVAVDSANTSGWRSSDQALTNHDLIIRYVDARGNAHQISGAYSGYLLTPGQRVKLDYREDKPDQPIVADPQRHSTMLLVFLLFGIVPLTMSTVMFASVWEDRSGHKPALRSPGVLTACAWARIPANLALLGGVVVSVWDNSVAAVGMGFPIIGAGALAHAVIAAIAGIRLSMVLTLLVIAVGFFAFGLFALVVG